jgi:hypothetical protein
MLGNSCVAAQLAGSQGELSFMEFVSQERMLDVACEIVGLVGWTHPIVLWSSLNQERNYRNILEAKTK